MRTLDELTHHQVSRRSFLGGVGATAGMAAAASVGLSGCGGSSGGSSGGSTNSLTVAVNGTQSAATAISQAVGPAFKQAHPGVTLNFMAINGTDWNDYFSKILTLIASGNPPDLTTVATEGLQLFADKGLAQPLNSYVMSDKASLQEYFSDVHPVLVESMMYQGNLYVLPTDFNAGNMYFSTDCWTRRASAIPPITGPRTTSTTWPSSGPDRRTRWGGTGWCGCGAAGPPGCTPTTPTCSPRAGGPAAAGCGTPSTRTTRRRRTARAAGTGERRPRTTPPTVEALQYMIDLKNAKLSASPDVGGGGTLQGLFAANHIAMTIGGGFWAGGLHTAGMAPTAFDVQYFPAWSVQKHLLGDAGYAMLKSSNNKEMAWEFMKSLTSPAALGALVAGNTSTPTRRSMMTASRYAPTGPAHWQVFYGTLDKFPNTTPIPAPPYYQQLATAFNVADHPGDVQRQRQVGAGRAAKRPGRVRLEFLDFLS